MFIGQDRIMRLLSRRRLMCLFIDAKEVYNSEHFHPGAIISCFIVLCVDPVVAMVTQCCCLLRLALCLHWITVDVGGGNRLPSESTSQLLSQSVYSLSSRVFPSDLKY